MDKNILVLMTALVPTTGHADLIEFAANIPKAKVHVLINGRTFEPIPSLNRWEDLSHHFKNHMNVKISHSVIDNAPQNPDDMPDNFWFWWRDEINRNFPEVMNDWSRVVASEPYGEQVAKVLNAEFIPYDVKRALNPARGEAVRKDLAKNWDQIIPETRRRLQLKGVLFGQESVGKTTVSKLVKDRLSCDWLLEYARPYLETVGSEVTEAKMENIHLGQYALQKKAFSEAKTPYLILDTDLFSTVGYYGIMKTEKNIDECIHDARALKSDVYYLMPDNIPLEKDQLRYGGDERESDMKYWIDILEANRLAYVLVPEGKPDTQADWIAQDMRLRFQESVKAIAKFNRE